MRRSIPDRTFAVIDAAKQVAKTRNAPPAAIALAWLLCRPGPIKPLIGARTLDQLDDNLKALRLQLTSDDLRILDAASAAEPGFPHAYLKRPSVVQNIYGGMTIETRRSE